MTGWRRDRTGRSIAVAAAAAAVVVADSHSPSADNCSPSAAPGSRCIAPAFVVVGSPWGGCSLGQRIAGHKSSPEIGTRSVRRVVLDIAAVVEAAAAAAVAAAVAMIAGRRRIVECIP